MSIPRKHDQRGVPIHPGEFLREDFLAPLGLSANALALALRVPVTRISEIVRERRGITADTALRLARYFRTTPDFWMKMQMSYDLAMASQQAFAKIEMEIFPAPRTRMGERKAAATHLQAEKADHGARLQDGRHFLRPGRPRRRRARPGRGKIDRDPGRRRRQRRRHQRGHERASAHRVRELGEIRERARTGNPRTHEDGTR